MTNEKEDKQKQMRAI